MNFPRSQKNLLPFLLHSLNIRSSGFTHITFLQRYIRVHFDRHVDFRVAMQVHGILLVDIHVDREDQRKNVPHHGDCHGSVGVYFCLRGVASSEIRGQHSETEEGMSHTTTAPIIGGKTMPPEMAATSIEPPSLVWRPRPRSARVKMVAKQSYRSQTDISLRQCGFSRCWYSPTQSTE